MRVRRREPEPFSERPKRLGRDAVPGNPTETSTSRQILDGYTNGASVQTALG
jgi:hypothetical protein